MEGIMVGGFRINGSCFILHGGCCGCHFGSFDGLIDRKIDWSINQLMAQCLNQLIDSWLVDERGSGMRSNNRLIMILG